MKVRILDENLGYPVDRDLKVVKELKAYLVEIPDQEPVIFWPEQVEVVE